MIEYIMARNEESWPTIRREFVENINQYIEEFAAAFLKRTQLKPEEVVMIIKYDYSGDSIRQLIWFEKRN